ncbi:peptide ABC transporter substrate-binding protein [Rhodopirellula europaea]|jgi:oligopeptide transport system substrate-binding protein|uniref:Bacterial extracellular solute-binding protein, family 5 n=1 Tax=Rhodopirellula europaea SH398 TaxID=1263868 RepID=M5SBC3_9BACT|nr:peptide ABC transporter substrate-binding protein [Rhodopirellula europaea]EMI28771.1 Bacterial extracellular solute-binding protein, family 5 [Rhodopirellula europaea SH398]
MPLELRRAFLILAAIVVMVSLIWASRFDEMPPAEFSFQNGTDPKTLDPHRATGQPESRILFNIFTGLLEELPEGDPDPETGVQPMTPQPGIAESYEVSPDNMTYTFQLRDDVTWSDGVPITSADFVWSWTRMLHPETACEYNFQLFGVQNAEAYATGEVKPGDKVEVELWDRPGETIDSEPAPQTFPRGTIVHGTLKALDKPPKPNVPEDATKEEKSKATADWQSEWLYTVDLARKDGDEILWDDVTKTVTYTKNLQTPLAKEDTQRAHNVLVAFDQLGGVEAPDPTTLIVHLRDPLPYFPYLTAYYPLFPVPRHCIEEHGKPMWTRPENIVTCGPYKIGLRKLRDRVRLVKDERWYDADTVEIESIDALSIESQNTALNMYETGELDWVTDPPVTLIEELKKREDYHAAPYLSVYYYELNTKRPPLDDVRVRKALSMAINREQIVREVTKAGQQPAFALVPPGIAGYTPAQGNRGSLEEAKRLLTEAGYPGGRGFPKFTILYNTSESHRAIAEVIQQQWQNNLNIKADLQNMEWGSFLDKRQQQKYDISRAAWNADYPDPNTFLDLFLSKSPQNNTAWKNPRYDELLSQAASESDKVKRMELLTEAEAIWADELPAIPIYYYVGLNIIKPNVSGLLPTPQDTHPFQTIRLEPTP